MAFQHEIARPASLAWIDGRDPADRSPAAPDDSGVRRSSDRGADKLVADVAGGGASIFAPGEPPSTSKMRKKKGVKPSTGTGKGAYEGFSGVLPGGATRSRMMSDVRFIRLAANVLEMNLRASSGLSGVDRPLALDTEVDKLLRKLKSALEAGKSPVDHVSFDADDTRWTLTGSLSVSDMHAVSKEAVTSEHSASSKYEGGATAARAATDGAHIGGKIGAKGGHAAGGGGGEEDSVEAAIEVGSDSSVTHSDEERSGDTGEVGVGYSTEDSAVTYRAELQCDLTLQYVEGDMFFDDVGAKSLAGMPCGWGTFTFDEPD